MGRAQRRRPPACLRQVVAGQEEAARQRVALALDLQWPGAPLPRMCHSHPAITDRPDTTGHSRTVPDPRFAGQRPFAWAWQVQVRTFVGLSRRIYTSLANLLRPAAQRRPAAPGPWMVRTGTAHPPRSPPARLEQVLGRGPALPECGPHRVRPAPGDERLMGVTGRSHSCSPGQGGRVTGAKQLSLAPHPCFSRSEAAR